MIECSDPTSQIIFDTNVTNAEAYIKKLNSEQSEIRYTMTHITGMGTAWGLYKMRRDVGRIRWGFFHHQKKIGTTILVDVDGGKDLVPVTIYNAHELSLKEFALKINEKINRAKNKKDVAHNQSTAIMQYIPSFIAQPMVTLFTYISLSAGFSVPPLGLRPDQFGHVVLTNVGSLGLQQGIAPLCPPMRAMGFICVGKSREMPWVVDGEIKIQKIMNFTSTGDHRFGDASIFINMCNALKGFVEDPEHFDETKFKGSAHWSELKKE